MVKVAALALATTLLSVPSFAAQVTYLSCDVPATESGSKNAFGTSAVHFDFTLDEQRGIVSYFEKQAKVPTEEKAVFGPDAVTWTTTADISKTVWRISRLDLSFTIDSVLDLPTTKFDNHLIGKCSLVDPSSREF